MRFKDFRTTVKQESIFDLLLSIHVHCKHEWPMDTAKFDDVANEMHGHKSQRIFDCFVYEAAGQSKNNFFDWGPTELRQHFEKALKMNLALPVEDFEWIPELAEDPGELEELEKRLIE